MATTVGPRTVTIAVRERLDRIRSEQRTGLADRLLQIGQDCAKRLKEPYRYLRRSVVAKPPLQR
jgi:hypothetical protein